MTQTTTPDGTIRLSISDVLDGLDLGIVTHSYAGFTIKERHCTDCDRRLPKVTIDGRLDTFPRCSAHAF